MNPKGRPAGATAMTSHRIRALLVASPDGMTVHDLREHIRTTPQNIRTVLGNTYGCYISGWMLNTTGPATAIWKCVAVPQDAPRPTPKWDTAHHREYNKQWARKKKAKAQQPEPARECRAHKKQGLTFWQPVQPWPNGVAPQ